MPKPTKVGTAARMAALGALTGMRPRTPLPQLAALVDGAAVLVEAGQPVTTVRLMLASARLYADQEDKIVAMLTSGKTKGEADGG